MKNNISYLNNGFIYLKNNEAYIIIDALYITEIGDRISLLEDLEMGKLLDKIRNTVFPYTDFPFAEYHSAEGEFNVEYIKKTTYEKALDDNSKNIFVSDTGMILCLRIDVLKNFAKNFNYETLVDSSIEILNLEYWNSIVEKFDIEDVALIYSVENDSDSAINGGGVFKILS